MKTLLMLSLLAFAACDDDTGSTAPMLDLSVITRSDLASAGDAAATQSASVMVKDFFYAPKDVTILKGGSVTWTWAGAAMHTASSNDGTTFDSPQQVTGTFMHTFTASGSFPYHCKVHGSTMSGTVTVQ